MQQRLSCIDEAAACAMQEAPGTFAAASGWVTAVTYTKISDSVLGTVFLSIGLAGVVVFVFTGKVAITLLSTLAVLLINVTVRSRTFGEEAWVCATIGAYSYAALALAACMPVWQHICLQPFGLGQSKVLC